MTTPQRSLIAVTVVLVALVAAVFVLASHEVSNVRGDFCSYVAVHDQATRMLAQNRARRIAEVSDVQLERKLGCPPG